MSVELYKINNLINKKMGDELLFVEMFFPDMGLEKKNES